MCVILYVLLRCKIVNARCVMHKYVCVWLVDDLYAKRRVSSEVLYIHVRVYLFSVSCFKIVIWFEFSCIHVSCCVGRCVS